MKEYEYSFQVSDITPYVDYCEKNSYELEKSNYQIRELFKHENKILARITTEIENKKRTCVLDFKDDNDTNKLVKEARETLPIKVSRDNRKAIDSMLEILGYHKDKILKRRRFVYKKGEVKFEIDECHDRQEGLDKLNNGNTYDLILMDIMMPNMSGETAIKKLKENPEFNTPVIALTADAVAGAREKYLSEGFTAYLAKPFTKDQIKEKIVNSFKII